MVANWGSGDQEEEEGEYQDFENRFVIDTQGDAEARKEVEQQQQQKPGHDPRQLVLRNDGLLLPGHVEIVSDLVPDDNNVSSSKGKQSSQKQQQREEEEAEEGEIGNYEQLDVDPVSASRYYAAEEKEERKRKEICPACGEEGHDRKRCPHIQCLACGAIDSHPTRNCPFSTSCFRCGGQGHRSRDCKQSRRRGGYRSSWECERCGSLNHSEATCPLLWRWYTYHSSQQRDIVRMQKLRKFEQGGRSMRPFYLDAQEPSEVSESEEEQPRQADLDKVPATWDPAERWCYNCASRSGHWGDDCPEPRFNPTRTNGEPSAFSEFVSRWGPFGFNIPDSDQASQSNDYEFGSKSTPTFDLAVGTNATVHVSSDPFPPRVPPRTVSSSSSSSPSASALHNHSSSSSNKKEKDNSKKRKHQDAINEKESSKTKIKKNKLSDTSTEKSKKKKKKRSEKEKNSNKSTSTSTSKVSTPDGGGGGKGSFNYAAKMARAEKDSVKQQGASRSPSSLKKGSSLSSPRSTPQKVGSSSSSTSSKKTKNLTLEQQKQKPPIQATSEAEWKRRKLEKNKDPIKFDQQAKQMKKKHRQEQKQQQQKSPESVKKLKKRKAEKNLQDLKNKVRENHPDLGKKQIKKRDREEFKNKTGSTTKTKTTTMKKVDSSSTSGSMYHGGYL